MGDWSKHFHPEIYYSSDVSGTPVDEISPHNARPGTPDVPEGLPHITVEGTGDGRADYYKFQVKSNSRVIIDMDHGFEGKPGELYWNPVMSLLTPDGRIRSQSVRSALHQ